MREKASALYCLRQISVTTAGFECADGRDDVKIVGDARQLMESNRFLGDLVEAVTIYVVHAAAPIVQCVHTASLKWGQDVILFGADHPLTQLLRKCKSAKLSCHIGVAVRQRPCFVRKGRLHDHEF